MDKNWGWLNGKLSPEDFRRLARQVGQVVVKNRKEARALFPDTHSRNDNPTPFRAAVNVFMETFGVEEHQAVQAALDLTVVGIFDWRKL